MSSIASPRLLVRYVDSDGQPRELFAKPGHAGSVLVLDRSPAARGDIRLIAHLGPDEPPENAALIARLYLNDQRGRRCRSVQPADLKTAPAVVCEQRGAPGGPEDSDRAAPIFDHRGNAHRLALLDGKSRGACQLRWTRRAAGSRSWECVSLREVIAGHEAYEPIRTRTSRALAHHCNRNVSVARLQAELGRLTTSPVVLNRRLRETVLERVAQGDSSMSEIALRCGRVKRDRRGRLSGETSWLARRIGAMPEAGASTATPWVHSEVLGLIARKGLDLSPREVEL